MQKVILDLLPGGVAPIVYASQYDDGRSIRFMLTEGGPDSQYSLNASDVITCNLTKPDGTETVINVANPGAGKTYVDLVNGADDYDQAGAYLGEIVLTKDARVIGSANFVLKVEEDAYGGQITTLTATGNPCTFTTDLADALVSLTADIVCGGGGGGTPSTPIPIVGHSELNLTRCGKNFFNASEDNITEGANICTISGNVITNTGANAYDAVRFEQGLPSGSYVFHASNISANGIIQISYYDGSYQDLGYLLSNNTTLQFTVPTVATKVRISLYSSQAGGMSVTDLQCELGSTATEYHAYNGQTFTVAFGQTVYGGVYDKSGRLTITHEIHTFDGSEYWDNCPPDWPTYGHCFTTPFSGSSITLCDRYDKNINAYSDNNGIIIPWSGTVAISDSRFSSPSDFRAEVANNNIHVLYPLATPIVIDVPSIPVFAENGTNNITSDCGGDVNVTYIKKV